MRESANEEVGMRERESESESERERERTREREEEKKKKERDKPGFTKKSVEKNFYFIRNVIVCECACVD